MNHVYKYRIDRRTIYWTIVHFIVYGLLGTALTLLYSGGYLSAWFTLLVVELISLMALSIPRKIVVTEDWLAVHSLLDITEIPREEIASVRILPQKSLKWFFPLFGGCGFFGYYGHYFDLKHFDCIRIYASEWKNMVEITDIYEDRLYVSCSNPEEFVREFDEENSLHRLHNNEQEENFKQTTDDSSEPINKSGD